jgi:anaerobic magnesium-protoporphyrin IX monomethyl ester cyclase
MMSIAGKEHYEWSDVPPYRIISNPWLDEHEVDRVDTVGRILELVYNSHRFDKTLEQLTGLIPLSSFFNEIAMRWEDKKVASLSMEQLFEFVWEVGKKILPAGRQTLFKEALVFDRCMADYPNPKKLPSYFSMEEGFDYRVSREEITLIRAKRGYPPKTKVRGIRWLFRSSFLKGGNGEGKSLLFIYLSAPGKKQEIDVVVEDGTFTTKDSLKVRCF